MNILNKFTLQNLKKNRKRTIVTIIGVMLSTILICATTGILTSIRQTEINEAIEYNGNYHIAFYDVPEDEAKYIEYNTKIKSYFYTYTLGYSKLENWKYGTKPYLYVLGLTDEAIQNLSNIKLINGRMPENDSELIISNKIITESKRELTVGDTITLEIGTRKSKDGVVLNQSNPYQTVGSREAESNLNSDDSAVLSSVPDSEKESNEEIVNTTTKMYKIVGIVEKTNIFFEENSSPGYTVFTKANNVLTSEDVNQNEDKIISETNNQSMQGNIKTKNIYVSLKNPQNRTEEKNFINDIVNTIENDTGITIPTYENSNLLIRLGNVSDDAMKNNYMFFGMIMAIIVVSSVFIIRNSFSISVSEKTKQYGILSSIGTTSKQIKKSVLFEAFIIGLIGISLGIICSILVVAILVAILNALFGRSGSTYHFAVSIPHWAIVFSCVISSITIFLSSISSAIRASKISPIDAIRENKDTKISAREIKTSKLTKKIFGIGGVIASKNLKRSRKKYRTTIISLVVSITIFIALYSTMKFAEKMTYFQYPDYGYNISLFLNIEKNEKMKLYNKILNDNDMDINRYAYYYYKICFINQKEYATEENINFYKELGIKQNDLVAIPIYKVKNDLFKEYIKSLGTNGDYKDAVILKNQDTWKMPDSKQIVVNMYNIQDGDTINLFDESNSELSKEIKITKVTNKSPMGGGSSLWGAKIFISEDNEYIDINDENTLLEDLYIDTDNPDKIEEYLQILKNENAKYSDMFINNVNSNVEENRNILTTISIFLYSFITIIVLIGVTNIFNTINTNIILRSREFAMLESIGMTKKEFNRMIKLESLLYGMKSLIIGVPLGILLSFVIYNVMAKNFEFGFFIPWMPILIASVFVFIIVGLTMKYSLNKINKQNIIETIRNDNI